MIDTGIIVLDTIINNPIQSMILFVVCYVVYRVRSPYSRKHFKYDVKEYYELLKPSLFPARDEYKYPEYELNKLTQQKNQEVM